MVTSKTTGRETRKDSLASAHSALRRLATMATTQKTSEKRSRQVVLGDGGPRKRMRQKPNDSGSGGACAGTSAPLLVGLQCPPAPPGGTASRRRLSQKTRDTSAGTAASGSGEASAGAAALVPAEMQYPLASLGGALCGPLSGELPAPLHGVIEDCLESIFGSCQLEKLMRIEWAGWQRLATTVLLNLSLDDEVRVERGLDAIKVEMPAFLRIAGDNMKEITAGREDKHLQRLLHADRLKRGDGQVWGRNDCMADSLLQTLIHSRSTSFPSG